MDVPCSNTGVLARRPEARWRLRGSDIERLSVFQRQALTEAVKLVAPGGRLVYSTCSLEREENGDVVHAVLQQCPVVRLEREETTLPTPGLGGGYCALLRRA